MAAIVALCEAKETTAAVLLPILKAFLVDSAASIRDAVVKEMPSILLSLQRRQFSAILDELLHALLNMADESVQKRILFIRQCEAVLARAGDDAWLGELFRDKFQVLFLSLGLGNHIDSSL
jgi:hypothetical protein